VVASAELVDSRLTACFELSDGAWSVTLAPSSDEGVQPTGSRRKRAAIRLLCKNDHVLPKVVKRRGSLTLDFDPNAAVGQGALPDRLVAPFLMPLQFDDSLYPYQRQGVAWLLRNNKALLADDMGLGKTAQAIAAARRLFRFGAASWMLVVAPRTLVSNWEAEFARWAPELVCRPLLPDLQARERAWRSAASNTHVSITSFDQLRLAEPHLRALEPDIVVVDEAHRLRKEDSAVSGAFRRVESNRIWLLTGTPVENNADDLAVLLSMLEPARFSRVDAKGQLGILRTQAKPYLLRRHKSEVLAELPPVVESNELLELTEIQRQAYTATLDKAARNREAAIKTFGKLREICDADPKSGSSSKLERIAEILLELVSTGEKAVVFSYLIKPLELLEERLNEVQIGNRLLIGNMSREKRDAAILDFKASAEITCLLASTRVASEGLTLTEASTVLFINRWWNPSSNAQARDRVNRIGQKNSVNVYSFTCADTVEERIPELLDRKSITFDELVEELNSSASELF